MSWPLSPEEARREYQIRESAMLAEIRDSDPGAFGSEAEGWASVAAPDIAQAAADEACPYDTLTLLLMTAADPTAYEVHDLDLLPPRERQMGRIAQIAVYNRLYTAAFDAAARRQEAAL